MGLFDVLDTPMGDGVVPDLDGAGIWMQPELVPGVPRLRLRRSSRSGSRCSSLLIAASAVLSLVATARFAQLGVTLKV